MRLLHFTALLAISMSGSAWAQRSPDVDNRVPELRVTELLQSGNSLRVTVQNVSTRTIRRVSAVLGKHKVDQDWSALAGGGVMPNATASLTISMAGLPAGGSRHHPAAPPSLELSSAVFADAGQPMEKAERKETVGPPPPAPPKPAPISVKGAAPVEPRTPKVEVAPPAVAATPSPRVQTAPAAPEPAAPPVKAPRERATPPPGEAVPKGPHPPAPIAVESPARVELNRSAAPTVAATPAPRAQSAPAAPEPAPTVKAPREQATPPPNEAVPQDPHPPVPIMVQGPARVELNRSAAPTVAATPAPRVQTAPPAPEPAAPTVEAPLERATPPPSESLQQVQPPPTPPAASAAPRPAGHAGTREQGVQDELSRLLSLIEPYEADITSPYPRTALRKMIAAVVAEQNAWAASQPAVTQFDQGQRSAVETFVYGLQAIHERRDLDDDTLRAQVQRFLKNRRQSLNR